MPRSKCSPILSADTRTLFRAYDRLRREYRRLGHARWVKTHAEATCAPYMARYDAGPEFVAVLLLTMGAELFRRGYHDPCDLWSAQPAGAEVRHAV